MQVIYHGHAFIEIKDTHGSILIDPFIIGNKTSDIKSIDALIDKNITAICITHGHTDHVWQSIELAAQHPEAIMITTFGVGKRLKDQWVNNTIYWLGIWWKYISDSYEILLTPALHDWAIMDSVLSTPPSGMIITINSKKIYHAGDTALTQDLKLVWELRWPIECAFLPIWWYYTMWLEDAVTACGWIKPVTVVPIHYNTFPEIKADPIEFARLVMLNKFAVPKVLVSGQYVIL